MEKNIYEVYQKNARRTTKISGICGAAGLILLFVLPGRLIFLPCAIVFISALVLVTALSSMKGSNAIRAFVQICLQQQDDSYLQALLEAMEKAPNASVYGNVRNQLQEVIARYEKTEGHDAALLERLKAAAGRLQTRRMV